MKSSSHHCLSSYHHSMWVFPCFNPDIYGSWILLSLFFPGLLLFRLPQPTYCSVHSPCVAPCVVANNLSLCVVPHTVCVCVSAILTLLYSTLGWHKCEVHVHVDTGTFSVPNMAAMHGSVVSWRCMLHTCTCKHVHVVDHYCTILHACVWHARCDRDWLW